jgi:hypothetical protein
VHRFTPSEVSELGDTADAFIAADIPLTGISQHNFPLPNLSQVLATLRDDLLNGKGFILFKGFPAQAWGPHKTAVAYMGLGTYLGYFISVSNNPDSFCPSAQEITWILNPTTTLPSNNSE